MAVDTIVQSSKRNTIAKKNLNISIYNKDCFEAFKLLQNNSIDLVITDPPYFIDGMDNKWNDKRLNRRESKSNVVKWLPVGMKFDVKQWIRLQEFFYKASCELMRVLKPGWFMLSFCQWRLYHRLTMAVEEAGFEIRDMIIWKHNGWMAKAFSQDHFVNKMNISSVEKQKIIKKLWWRKTPQLRPLFEPLVLSQKPKDWTFVNNWLNWEVWLINKLNNVISSTVFFEPKLKDKMIEHMTVKPVPLIEKLIKVFSKEWQTVLDPFLWTGTSWIASKNTGRHFIGFEREPKYYNIALKRIHDNQDIT